MTRKRTAALASIATPPKPPPLEQTLDRLDPDYLECRDFGHVWQPDGAQYFAALRLYEQSLRCRRCSTIRTRQLGMRGEILHNGYDYPDGYQMPPGTGHLTSTDRDAIRIRTIQTYLSPRDFLQAASKAVG